MKKVILGLAVLANLAFSLEEITQAQIEYVDKECKNKNIAACVGLGDLYLFGLSGLNKDYKKAKFYFEKVCNKDKSIKQDKFFLEACTNLGLMYDNGLGVKQSYKKATELYNIACNGGDFGACQNIGTIYYGGNGVKKDAIKAAGYFRKACDGGIWVACKNFATYHYNYGDKSKASQYFKIACELGKNSLDVKNIPKHRENWEDACNKYSILK